MTEQEAKTKWCPFARIPSHISGAANVPPLAINRLSRPDSQAAAFPFAGLTCIGSACMAWRWNEQTAARKGTDIAAYSVSSEDRGFCGLAGRPSPS